MPKKTDIVSKIEKCGALAMELKAMGDAITAKLDGGDHAEVPVSEIEIFNKKFDEFRKEIDGLPIRDGQAAGNLAKEEKDALAAALPELIRKIDGLVEANRILSQAARKNVEFTSERLSAIRKARGIFEKFVRKPAAEDSRFYDKRV